LLAGKVCFYVFMCFENEPVDKAGLIPRAALMVLTINVLMLTLHHSVWYGSQI
jgi:hypothetical protein